MPIYNEKVMFGQNTRLEYRMLHKEAFAVPLVTIVIPAYNAGATISAAVESVRAQTVSDWELVIVDDGSVDDTAALCDAMAAEDPRIRVLHKANAGVSAARNDGMDAAAGDWIVFLDADDLYEPSYLETLLAAQAEAGADSAACGFSYLWPDGRLEAAPAPMPQGFYTPEQVTEGFILPLLCDRLSASLTLGTIWRCLFRTSLLRQHRLRFSGAYLEDEIFLIEYFSLGQSLACVDVPLYRYYQNPGSVTHKYLLDYVDTFSASLDAKKRLVAQYTIPVPPHWTDNSAWAGLLIAVANRFAPGAPGGLLERARDLKTLCALPVFQHAYRHYRPQGLNRNKAVVVRLLQSRMFLALSALYTFKNRNR